MAWLMFLEATLRDDLFDNTVHGCLSNKVLQVSCYCRSPGLKFVSESLGLGLWPGGIRRHGRGASFRPVSCQLHVHEETTQVPCSLSRRLTLTVFSISSQMATV